MFVHSCQIRLLNCQAAAAHLRKLLPQAGNLGAHGGGLPLEVGNLLRQRNGVQYYQHVRTSRHHLHHLARQQAAACQQPQQLLRSQIEIITHYIVREL